MTDEELRKLDAEVHREVLGRDPHVDRHGNRWAFVTDVPPYSSNIRATWQVVDQWRNPDKPGGYGELEIRCEGAPDTGLWHVYLGIIAEAHDNSLPLAICLAALKAARATKPQGVTP